MAFTSMIVCSGTWYARAREYSVMPGCRLTRTPPAQSASQAADSWPEDAAPGRSSRTAGAASLNREGRSHSAIGGGWGEVTARAAVRPPQAGAVTAAAATSRGTTIPLLGESRIFRIPPCKYDGGRSVRPPLKVSRFSAVRGEELAEGPSRWDFKGLHFR